MPAGAGILQSFDLGWGGTHQTLGGVGVGQRRGSFRALSTGAPYFAAHQPFVVANVGRDGEPFRALSAGCPDCRHISLWSRKRASPQRAFESLSSGLPKISSTSILRSSRVRSAKRAFESLSSGLPKISSTSNLRSSGSGQRRGAVGSLSSGRPEFAAHQPSELLAYVSDEGSFSH